jgi:hypothetical protein
VSGASTQFEAAALAADAPPRIPGWIDYLGGLITRHPGIAIRLGNIETRFLVDRLAGFKVDRPIYITGLARAGTTILLELLATQPGVVTHRYRDFPAVLFPYMWNRWLDMAGSQEGAPVERAHRDGIFVTAESPEAMEEMVWSAFFNHLHDPAQGNMLDGSTHNLPFESFYRDHLKKMLMIRGGSRFASKENYNLTRLLYLQRLFPDARFIIPIRHPAAHIASLVKEHRLFCDLHKRDPRTLEHFRRVGHFEFGADLRPINTGDPAKVREIEQLWRTGDHIRGWARYWAMIYGFVADQLDSQPALRKSALIIRFEDLCDRPEESLARIMEHCELDCFAVTRLAARLHSPTYYRADFCRADQSSIDEETLTVRQRFGY